MQDIQSAARIFNLVYLFFHYEDMVAAGGSTRGSARPPRARTAAGGSVDSDQGREAALDGGAGADAEEGGGARE